MPNSLKVQIKKLEHDGKIDSEECSALLKKLEGHDKKIKADVIDEIYSEFEQVVKNDSRTSYYWTDLWVEFMKVCEKLKGKQK